MEKLAVALAKKAEVIDRYREILEREGEGTDTEMHLAVVDPWGGELFIPAFFDALRATASKAPFDTVWFVDLSHMAHLASDDFAAIEEVTQDVAGMAVGTAASVAAAYIRRDQGSVFRLLNGAEATDSKVCPDAFLIERTHNGQFVGHGPVDRVAECDGPIKGELILEIQ